MVDLVARIPRLPVPGETLFAHTFDMFVGGKGANQAIAAKRLGADQVSLIGRIGSDDFGTRVASTLEQARVDITYLGRDSLSGTGTAIPLVFDDGGNSIISVPMANMAMTVDHVKAAATAIEQSHALLLQFEVPMACNIAAARIARAAGIPVFLNTAPVAELPGELLALATVVVANEVEAAALAPGNPPTPADQALAFVRAGVPLAVVTLGADGAVLALGDEVTSVPPFLVDAVDSVGAGDAFCGGLAVAIAEGRPPLEAVRFASAAGALAATRHGAAVSLPMRQPTDDLLQSAY
jgi:ribokinase